MEVVMEMFVISDGEGVCCNPGGRFHGWLFRRHPDGQWVSVRKLEAEPPPTSPLLDVAKKGVADP
jgi:hypothetical protein